MINNNVNANVYLIVKGMLTFVVNRLDNDEYIKNYNYVELKFRSLGKTSTLSSNFMTETFTIFSRGIY